MRSQYQKESVALSHIDPLLPERCFMMLGLDPHSFKEAFHDPILQAPWMKSLIRYMTTRKEDGTLKMDLQNQNSL